MTRVEGDLFDPAALNRAVEGMAAVVHLAAVFHRAFEQLQIDFRVARHPLSVVIILDLSPWFFTKVSIALEGITPSEIVGSLLE